MKFKLSSRKPLPENMPKAEKPVEQKPAEKKAKKEKKNDPDKVS